MTRPRPTLRDVAERAQVSIATASRALNDSSLISTQTAARVKEAATALNYRSDAIGRALRSRNTLSLGLVVPNINNPFFPALVQAIEVEAKRAGWSMLLADSLDSLEVERENIDVLISRRVDAIVISPLHRTKSRPALVSAAQLLPVIQFDRIAAASLPYVGVDQYGAMTKLLDHLEAGGRSRIAYVGSDTGESTAAERLTAFRDWTAARNLPQGYSLTPSTMEGGTSAARRILARRPDVDAIACCNDVIAIGVLFHLGARGIAVPGEVAVTGFDNTIGSQLCRPTLTTATQPLEEVARQAVAWAQSADPPPERRAVLDATIEIRESTVGRTAAGLNRPGAPE